MKILGRRKTWQGLRVLGGIFAVTLIAGELWRSWGGGRPLPLVMDDVLMGGFLLVTSYVTRTPTRQRRALLSAAWGMLAGMLYLSFFGKVYAPDTVNSGNWSMATLTLLVGAAWTVSLIGLAASVAISGEGDAE